MLYVLWGVSSIGTFSLSIIKDRTKIARRIILFGVFLFLWILLGWSSGAFDVEIGISRYVNYQQYVSSTEIGYTFLIMLGHKLGLTYRTFFVLCSFFELSVFYWYIHKNCVKPDIVVFLFLLFPLVIYFQYIRNILAFAFVLIGLDRLINKKKAYILRYMLLVIIATSIHFSCLFFLLYLPFSFVKRKNAVILTFILVAILFASSSIQFLSGFLYDAMGEAKADTVLGTAFAKGGVGRVFALSVSILEFFVVYFLLRFFFKIQMNDRYSAIFFNFNLLSLLLIPLTLFMGVGFARIPTLMTVFNYSFFVDKISMLNKQRNRIFCYVVLLSFLVVLFVLNFRNIEYRQLVLYPFFEENELITKLLG